MGTYTIGFLGHFAYTERICDYMDTFLVRALEQHGEVRAMLTLRHTADRLMAGRVLEIGKLFPGLRLVPVITEQEERIYKKNGPSLLADERKRRLDAADGYEVVPDTLSSNKLPGYHQRFDTKTRHYLLYKVFTVVYIIYHRLLTTPGSAACEVINSRFRQFRRMLELLAESRSKGIDIGCFDLLDFDNYDRIFNQFGWADRLEVAVTCLCDLEPDK